jgi:hypothetical protein
MSGGANPVTMTRMCKACSEVQEPSWVITKSKAKEAFLLTDKDCKSFLSASYPFGFFGNSNERTFIFLLSDVVTMSFAKWGGPDGLESEITKRKAAAAIRYAKRQSSSKPQKKRPKIESLSSRPGDDLLSLRSFLGSTLPIPVSFLKPFLYCPTLELGLRLKMTHCAQCSLCDVLGTTNDIIMHERLEHGVIDLELERGEERVPTPTEGSKIIPEAMQPAEELVQLLEQAEVKYDESRLEDEHSYGHRMCCLFTLGDCKVSVDRSEGGCEGVGGGHLVICCQIGPKMLPVELASIGFAEYGDETTEADIFFFDKLKEALKLRETTPSQLLAALLWRGIPNFECDEMFGWSCDEQETPVFCQAWDLLGLAENSDGISSSSNSDTSTSESIGWK